MSNRTVTPYSADQVEITIGAPPGVTIPLPGGLSLGHLIDGRGTDAFLSVAREVPTASKVTGADGEVAPVKSRNLSGSFTITLMQTSTSNTVLSALINAWEEAPQGFFFPVTVTDTGAVGTLYEAERCWVQGHTPGDFGASVGARVWVIECGVLRMNTTGRT